MPWVEVRQPLGYLNDFSASSCCAQVTPATDAAPPVEDAPASAAASQGNSGPAFGRVWRPLGPLIHVRFPSVKAVQLSALRQTSSPPLPWWAVVRCSALPLEVLKCSFSRHDPTIPGIWSAMA